MKVSDILLQKGSEVISIEPDRSVREAVDRLVERRIGALLVLEGGEIRGIITERDILRETAEHANRLDRRKVSDAMTSDLIVGVPDDDLNYVMGIMTRNKIRHLPIIDGNALKGIISIGDVVWASLTEAEFENRHLREYIAGSY